MSLKLDLKIAQDQITNLMLAYPELSDDEVLREDMIEAETGTFEFLQKLVRLIGSTTSIHNGLTDYIGELQERKARLERREYALRQLIFKVMQTAELRKAELAEATISIRNGQPKVQIINEQEIPRDFLRVKTEPDKTKIKAALQAHDHVPGCCLSNAESVLAIIVK